MSEEDFAAFLIWMQTHTAFGRLGHDELVQAFDRAKAEAGYTVSKVAAGVQTHG